MYSLKPVQLRGTLFILTFILIITSPTHARVRIMPMGDSITYGLGSGDGCGYLQRLHGLLWWSTGYRDEYEFVGKMVSSKCCPELRHEGYPGWHADQVLLEVYQWLTENPADIVLLHIGANDIHGLCGGPNPCIIAQKASGIAAEINQILDEIDRYETDNNREVLVILARIVNCATRTPDWCLCSDDQLVNCVIPHWCSVDQFNERSSLNRLIQEVANTRLANGDTIKVVDMERAFNYKADMYADPFHPNDHGYDAMAMTWLAALGAPFLSSYPQINNLTLQAMSPDNMSADDLICHFDLTGGATTTATAWYKNELPVMTLYMPFEGGGIPFEYGDTNAFLDYSGNGHNGRQEGNVSWGAKDGYDGCGAVNLKENGKIDCGDIMPSGAYTKTAWIKWEDDGNNNTDKGYNILSGNSDHAFWIVRSSEGGLYLCAGHVAPYGYEANGTMDEFDPNDIWHFVGVTYDPTVNGGTMVLYKDGDEVCKQLDIPMQDPTDKKVWVGAFNGANNWSGLIDDVRIYSHALSPQQILSLSTLPKPNGEEYHGKDRIKSSETVAGDEWQCHVTPFSSMWRGTTKISNSVAITSDVRVTNLSLALTPAENSEAADLLCSYNLAGEATTAATAWYQDGLPVMSLYFPMEGGRANALLDYSGSRRRARIVGRDDGLTWHAKAGYDGHGTFYFNQAGILVNNVMPYGAYTKTAWVKLDPEPERYHNIISGEMEPVGHAFWVFSGPEDGYKLHLGAGHAFPFDAVKDPAVFPAEEWVFVAVTYDSSMDCGTMKLYRNGNLVDSETDVVGKGDDYCAYIGSYAAKVYWKGYIDDARIYHRALSPEQIQTLYNQGAGNSNKIVSQEIKQGNVWEWEARVTPFSSTHKGRAHFAAAVPITLVPPIANSVDINLEAGWSIISLPVVPESLKLSDIFPGAGVVYDYEKNAGYVRVQGDHALEVGKGYWIFLNEARTYTLTGEPIQEYACPVENGWYMIGGCSSSAQASVTNGNIEVIYGYVPGSGYQRLQEPYYLESGGSYWILFSNITGQTELKVASES